MKQLPERQAVSQALAAQLAAVRPMRAGWVGERWMKCGKASCACRHDPRARHGPYVTLTTPGNGKTRTRYLSGEAAALAKEQVEAARKFRALVKEVRAAAEQWADAELAAAAAASDEAAQKGASPPPSRRRSPRKSRRS